MGLRFAHAALFQRQEGVRSSLASEHLVVTGTYQALKWAMEYAQDDGTSEMSLALRHCCGTGLHTPPQVMRSNVVQSLLAGDNVSQVTYRHTR